MAGVSVLHKLIATTAKSKSYQDYKNFEDGMFDKDDLVTHVRSH